MQVTLTRQALVIYYSWVIFIRLDIEYCPHKSNKLLICWWLPLAARL